METLHKDLLQDKRMYLLEYLQPVVDDLVDRLYEVKILTDNLKQEIEAQQTRVEKVRKILDILPKRGPDTFDKFCSVLNDSKAAFILDEFRTALGEPKIVQETYRQPADTQSQKDEQIPIEESQERTTLTEPRHPEDKATDAHGGLSQQPFSSTSGMGATGTQVPPETNMIDVHESVCKSSKQRQNSTEPNSTDKTSSWPNNLDLSLKYLSSIVIEKGAWNNENISSSQAYRLSASGTKLAVIVKNTKFDDDSNLQEIGNTDGDFDRLKELLQKLDFDVKTYTDQTKEELMKELRNVSSADYIEAIILIIISYGGHNTVLCKNGTELNVSEITEAFSGKLLGKPKIIFLQAFGKRFKGSVHRPTAQEESLTNMTDSMKCLKLKSDLPDVIVVKATHPYVSDGTDYSSLFLLALWDMLHRFYKDKHILEILTQVNELKKDETGKPTELCQII